MANTIALIIFALSFIGFVCLILRKISALAGLPEQEMEIQAVKSSVKHNISLKTDLIKQAVLRNKKVEAAIGKTAGKFKTIFATHIAAIEDSEKAEKIHKEGDYWQKVETHNSPQKKKRTVKKSKSGILPENIFISESVEKNTEPEKVKKPRTRKKKTE